jgi:Flp pilus assembly protein TadD
MVASPKAALRPGWRAVLAGVVLLAAASVPACTKGPRVTTPPAASANPGDKGPAADHSAAYGGHEDTLPAEAAVRVRPAPKPVSDRDAAISAVASGNPEGARDFLRGHLEATPADLEARLALSRALTHVGEYEAAGKVLADPKGAPSDPAVVQRRVDLMLRRGDAKGALALLQSARKADPKSLPLRGDHLDLLVRTGRGDTPEAKDLTEGLYDAYEAGQAKTAEELLAVALAALSRGSTAGFKDANMVLEDAEQLAPAKDGTWIADRILLTRADMFREKYASDDALTTYGLVLERDAWHADALAGSARVYADSLQFAAASRVADEALQAAPSHPGAHAVLAKIALIEGRREEARTRVDRQVLAVDPVHPSGVAVLAGLAMLEGQRPVYEKWRRRAFELDPRGVAFFRDLADILGFLHLYPEADEVLAEAVKLAPDDPGVQSALGVNLLRLGEEARGREALQKAWKRDRFNERTLNVLELYEETIDKRYGERKVGDLTVRLPDQDREFVEAGLVRSVDASRKALDTAYGIKAGALRLEFFDSPDAFSIRTVGVPSLGAVAVCFGPVITFIGPYMGVHNVDMVIRHELAHVYAIRKSGGRVPRWFTEGLSEWESELADPAWARESAELLSAARRAGKLRRLSDLELAFIRAESAEMMEVAYATSAYAIRYLGETYGREKLVAILEGYAAGKDTADLFAKHFGKELSIVEKDFEQWFFAQLDAKIGGWSPTREGGKPDARDGLWVKAQEEAAGHDEPAAIATLEKLVTTGGDGYLPRLMLGRLLVDGPKPAAAERHLEAAIGHHKEAVEPLVLLANLARTQGDATAEIGYLSRALLIDGDSIEPAARLLMLATVTGDKAKADIALRRVQSIAPLHPIALAGEGLARSASGDRKGARSHVDRALRDLGTDGPGDTFAVAALAASAVGEAAKAKELAELARRDRRLPAVAKKKLSSL